MPRREFRIGMQNPFRATVSIVAASQVPPEQPEETADLTSSTAAAISRASPSGGAHTFPPLTTQISGLFQSAAAFVGDGLALVDDTEFRRRLDVCRTCDQRAGKRCTACGCWIGLKARGSAFQCPLGKW